MEQRAITMTSGAVFRLREGIMSKEQEDRLGQEIEEHIVSGPMGAMLALDKVARDAGVSRILERASEEDAEEWLAEIFRRSFETVVDAADKVEKEIGVRYGKKQLQKAGLIYRAQLLLMALEGFRTSLEEAGDETSQAALKAIFESGAQDKGGS